MGARLSCQVRDINELLGAWKELTHSDRRMLTEHLVADGIYESAIMFRYLPFFLQAAKGNRYVKLRRALIVLSGLLVEIEADGIKDVVTDQPITVDIQDLCFFTRDVRSPRVFEA